MVWPNVSLKRNDRSKLELSSLGSCVVLAKIILLLPRILVYNELPLDTRKYETHRVQHNGIQVCYDSLLLFLSLFVLYGSGFHCFCPWSVCMIAEAVTDNMLL